MDSPDCGSRIDRKIHGGDVKKSEKEHLNKVAELGCVACFVKFGGWGTPAEIHHVRATAGMGQRSKSVIGLCHPHHRTGGYGEAFHSGSKAFEKAYGTELELLELVENEVGSYPE